jgi:uncharacterized damage-inducible protein DinB
MINEEQLFKHMHFVRSVTLKALQSTSEQLADEIPQGFKNNIRWNLGHIYVIHELLTHYFSGDTPQIPTNYDLLFNRATTPNNWERELPPPTLKEISNHLTTQTDRIESGLKGRLFEVTTKSFQPTKDITYSTIGELLNFAVWHEGNHIGSIKALKRACGVTNLWEKD